MEKEHNRIKGIRTWTIIIPSIIILAILHISIVLCVFNVSAKSREMSETMQKCAEQIDDVTSLQAGSSILSDTITSFAYKPYIEESHEVNYTPLIAYSNEYVRPRRPDDVISKMNEADVSSEAKDKVIQAAECVRSLLNDQAHVIALIDSVYHLNHPAVTSLPKYSLDASETSLSDSEKLSKAIAIVFSEGYRENKRVVSESVTNAINKG